MTRVLDIAGHRFGRLTVTTRAPRPGGPVSWHVVCDCGNTKVVSSNSLRSNRTLSCGCLQRERASEHVSSRNWRHGQMGTPTYRSWSAMRNRGTCPTSQHYARYGARGITVCAEWSTFANFLADMGPRPPGTSIDRIDNTKGYEPGNCRWATRTTQGRNTSAVRLITYRGESKCVAEWRDELGLTRTVCARLYAGWDMDRALSTPVKARSKATT